MDNNIQSYDTDQIPVNDKLRRLGVRKIVKHGEFMQFILAKHKNIFFNINKRNFNQTIERFQESAANGFAGLSRDDIKAMTDVLINPVNGYTQYLISANGKEEDDSQSLAHIALEIIEHNKIELFSDQFGMPYIVVEINGHLETLAVESSRFRNWLSKKFFEKSESAKFLSNDALTKVLNILIAKVEFDSPRKDLEVRVSGCTEKEPYTIYYDLTNQNCEVVRITPKGWSILKGKNIPTVFRKYKIQKSQVYPSRKYSNDVLDKFVDLLNIHNLEEQREQTPKGRIISKNIIIKKRELFKGYFIGLYYPDIPKPVFMLYGGQNAAKSTTKKLVKQSVDPTSPNLLRIPNDNDAMAQQLMHNYVCFYDNLTKLTDEQSNALCRASTKAGDSKRKLFENDEDIVYEYIRCTGFSGINLVAINADLLSRGIIFKQQTIPPDRRREDKEIEREFNKLLPQLLGFVFDILSKVLRYKKAHHDKIKDIKASPRMVDFAQIAEIASRCVGNRKNEFIDAYNENIDLQTEAAIEGNPVGIAIKSLMRDKTKWNGTMSDLLTEFEFLAGELNIDTRDELWPKAPHILGRRLAEIEDHLKNLKSGAIIFQRYTIDQKNNIKGIELRKKHQKHQKHQRTQK